MDITIIGTGDMSVFGLLRLEAAASRIAAGGGLRPVDAGPLARARDLEALGHLHMAIQESLGAGYGSAVELLA